MRTEFSETSIIGLHGIEAEASDQNGFEAHPLVARSGHTGLHGSGQLL